jgi:hypothetical protein
MGFEEEQETQEEREEPEELEEPEEPGKQISFWPTPGKIWSLGPGVAERRKPHSIDPETGIAPLSEWGPECQRQFVQRRGLRRKISDPPRQSSRSACAVQLTDSLSGLTLEQHREVAPLLLRIQEENR